MRPATRLPIAAAAFMAALCFGAPAGHAYGNAPWCAVVDLGAGNVQWQCEYYSAEDCQPNVIAGDRGSCNRNPYYVAPVGPPPWTHHWRRKHHAQQ
jgi:hypothetical protein